MQTTQLTGERGWLDAAAAASVHRIDRALGRLLDINEAGRSWAQQMVFWETYQRDGAPIALHPDTPSVHQLGNAIDTDDSDRVALLNEHGWFQTVYRWVDGKYTLVEPWHFEYDRARDQHLNDAPPAAPAAEIPLEDDVTVIYCAGTEQKYQTILAGGGKFWIVPNGSVEHGPIVWLTDLVLSALVQDARASKSKGAPPVLIYDTTAKHWLYAAHGGVVILRSDEERRNIIEQLNPPRLKVPGSYANIIVQNIREGKDG